MTRLPLTLAAAVAVLALAGCGGGDDDTRTGSAAPSASPAGLSKADYIAKGDAVCAKLQKDTEAVPPPADESAFGPYITQVVTLAEGARAEFAALTPPADGAATHKTLLDSLDSAITSGKGAATAAGNGDTVTAADLLTEAEKAGAASDAAAKSYGFTVCGSESDDEPQATGELTKEEYVAAGDAICGKLDADVAALPAPADETALSAYLVQFLELASASDAEFAALVPPADAQELHQAQITANEQSLASVEGAVAAADGGDTVSAGDLLTQAEEQRAAAADAAKSYGFTVCGTGS